MTGLKTSDPIQSEAMRRIQEAGAKEDREARKTNHLHGAFYGGRARKHVDDKKLWEADLENQNY